MTSGDQSAAQPFDRAALKLHRARAERLGGRHVLLERTAEELAARLTAIQRSFPVALASAPVPATLVAALAAVPGIGRLHAMAPPGRGGAMIGEEEWLPVRPGSLDLAVSALTLHLAGDLPGALVQIARALRPDGLFLGALFAGDTLSELRQAFAAAEAEVTGGAAPRVAPFADIRALGDLLGRAGFALPVADLDRVVVRYASPRALMAELRAIGETNALTLRSRRPLTRAVLARACAVYAERFGAADGRVPATFEIAVLTGWKPHESQQQPLAPGSARRRLSDALGAEEVPLPERARPGRPKS